MLSLLLLACSEVVSGLAPPCVPDAPVPEVSTVAPGEATRIRVHPLATDYDTAVYVGASRAEVLGVQREGCEAYDTCLGDEGCSACGDCDACGPLLADCVETVRVRVPVLEAGTYPLVVYSQYGETLPGSLSVGGADTGADTGGDTASSAG